MGRERPTICVTLPPELITWIDERVKDRTYGSRSHAIERAILELKKDDTIADFSQQRRPEYPITPVK
jgi:Arc/MetJ-type ribon-helix-helix transcriptional regulator